ncbi:hypothetical protein H181DRAFT_03355 [Streptomyces sp. WMMB 714]|nr:hypothetical protein H181DRAFT_03355 [Streptomyces sp. WMMB 714]
MGIIFSLLYFIVALFTVPYRRMKEGKPGCMYLLVGAFVVYTVQEIIEEITQ